MGYASPPCNLYADVLAANSIELGVERGLYKMLTRFAKEVGFDIAAEFVEIETGKGSDALDHRPQLAAALAKAQAMRCPVVVAKLDRLSGDLHFISGLMAHRVPFVVTELGRTSIPSFCTSMPRWPKKSAP